MDDIGWNWWNINYLMIIIWWLLILILRYDLRQKYNINLVKMKVYIKIAK
jgi:hypothetical protein